MFFSILMSHTTIRQMGTIELFVVGLYFSVYRVYREGRSTIVWCRPEDLEEVLAGLVQTIKTIVEWINRL